jgi:hypothetical protein
MAESDINKANRPTSIEAGRFCEKNGNLVLST